MPNPENPLKSHPKLHIQLLNPKPTRPYFKPKKLKPIIFPYKNQKKKAKKNPQPTSKKLIKPHLNH